VIHRDTNGDILPNDSEGIADIRKIERRKKQSDTLYANRKIG